MREEQEPFATFQSFGVRALVCQNTPFLRPSYSTSELRALP